MSQVLESAPTGAAGSMRVADAIAELLVKLGVGHVFGVVGSGNFHVTNALIARGVPYTAARHEGGAATMADAYSRVSGKLGIVSTHQGCGFTNALTGIGEAAKSRTPLLVLTAEAQSAAIRSNFAMDQAAAARSVGAVAERVHGAASVRDDVVRAWRTAVLERRTVVLNLPLDVQAQTVEGPLELPVLPASASTRPAQRAVDDLVEVLARAKRPVFVAGRGGRGAGEELRALGAEVGALLATSAVAKGLFLGDPADLGISGGFSSVATAELIADADCIVGWGCAMNMWTMRHGRLIGEGTRVVQVDLESSELGANRPIALGVVGDSAVTAADALTAWRARGLGEREGYRSSQVLVRIAAESDWRHVELDNDRSDAERIDPRVVSVLLDDALPAERIVSVDSGNFMGYPSQFLGVPDEHGFCFTQAFQAIGLGLATAIGAASARPDRLPVLGTGDGGFLMALSELETAVRMRIPLVVLVYNDAAYGAEVHHFREIDAKVDLQSVEFPDTDIAAIARGCGAEGVTVRTREDFARVRELIAARTPGEAGVPLVIDAKIAADGGAWWLAEAFKGH